MKILSAGKYIKEERMRQNLTQDDVCHGLCSQVTLSRIEAGVQTPNFRTLNALMERLGVSGEKFYAILSEEEERIEDLKLEIRNCCIQSESEKGLAFVRELEKLTDPKDRLLRQFLLHMRGILGDPESEYPLEKQQEMYMEAIRMTVSDFSGGTILGRRYCLGEMEVIMSIAQTWSGRGEHLKALNMFRDCCEYVETYNQNMIESAGMIPFSELWYAMELGMCGFYRESMEYAERGRMSCIKYGRYRQLAALVHTKAESYFHMGDKENGKKQSVLAYSLYCVLDDKYNKASLVKDAKKYYNLDLEGC